jgi:small-conductance mechanosensitive channel
MSTSAAASAAESKAPVVAAIEHAPIIPAVEELIDWLVSDYREVLTLAAISIGVFLILVVVRDVAARQIRRHEHRGQWVNTIGGMVGGTMSVFLLLGAFTLVAHGARPPDLVLGMFRLLFIVVAVVQGALWAQTALLGLVTVRHQNADDDSALNLMRGLVRVVVWAIAVLTLLANLGIDITGLIAGLGIGGIAIGFAAQGILGDLFAAFSIMLDKPFKRGDTIQYDNGASGTVEEIGIKSTRIRALDGQLIVVSNSQLLSAPLSNFAMFTRRRVVLQFGVAYETAADLLESIPTEVRNLVSRVPDCVFDRCHLRNFGASSLDFEMAFFVEHKGFLEMMNARQAVMLAMIRRFQDLRVTFAYPVQVQMLAAPDGEIIDPRNAPRFV